MKTCKLVSHRLIEVNSQTLLMNLWYENKEMKKSLAVKLFINRDLISNRQVSQLFPMIKTYHPMNEESIIAQNLLIVKSKLAELQSKKQPNNKKEIENTVKLFLMAILETTLLYLKVNMKDQVVHIMTVRTNLLQQTLKFPKPSFTQKMCSSLSILHITTLSVEWS